MFPLFLFLAGMQAPTAESIERAFAASRTDLTAGRLTIEVDITRSHPRDHKETFVETIYFDGQRFRCDRTPSGVTPTYRTIYCEHCEREKCYVFFDERALDPKMRQLPLRLEMMGLVPGTGRVGGDRKFDPRVIGVGARSFFAYQSISVGRFVGRTDRSPPTVAPAEWHGKVAWVVSCRLNHGPSTRATYVPDLGYSMVKYELNAEPKEPGDVPVKLVMESEPDQFGPKKHWFPRKVLYQSFRGNELTEKNVIHVKEAVFNEPLPADTFKIAGMGVPPGAAVMMLVPGAVGSYVWDGSKIVGVKTPRPVAEADKAPEAETDRWRARWSTASVALSLAGVAALGVYYRRSRAKGRNGP